MAQDDPYVAHFRNASLDTFTKFEYYFIGLNFTLLALAVQSAPFTGPTISDAAELLGWLLLMIAGVIGLRRLMAFPNLYHLAHEKERTRENIELLHDSMKQGAPLVMSPSPFEVAGTELEPYRPQELLQILQIKHKSAGEVMEEIQRSINLKAKIQRGLFTLGLGSVMIARGYAPGYELIVGLVDGIREMMR